MFKIFSILSVFYILVGCASTTPLRSVHYIADDWIVAGMVEQSKIFVHTRNLGNFKETIVNSETTFSTYVIKHGDTLSRISKLMYGSTEYAGAIAFHNDIDNPNEIIVDEPIRIPFINTTEHDVVINKWEVRYVNASDVSLCINVTFINNDYAINIADGWYHLEPTSTIYVGDITQEYWELDEAIVTLDDAAWAVNIIEVVDYSKQTGCKF